MNPSRKRTSDISGGFRSYFSVVVAQVLLRDDLDPPPYVVISKCRFLPFFVLRCNCYFEDGFVVLEPQDVLNGAVLYTLLFEFVGPSQG